MVANRDKPGIDRGQALLTDLYELTMAAAYLENRIDAPARAYPVSIVTDAIRHLDQSKSESFLETAGNSGATLVSTAEVMARLSRQPAA